VRSPSQVDSRDRWTGSLYAGHSGFTFRTALYFFGQVSSDKVSFGEISPARSMVMTTALTVSRHASGTREPAFRYRFILLRPEPARESPGNRVQLRRSADPA